MSSAFNGTSGQRLTKLINEANNTGYLYPAQIRYQEPKPYTPPEGRTQNTVVPVLLVNLPPQDVYYHRLNLGILTSLEPIQTPPAPYFIEDILNQINIKLGLDLLIDEIVNHEILTDQQPVYLTASPDSLAWLGELQLLVTSGGGGTIIKVLKDGGDIGDLTFPTGTMEAESRAVLNFATYASDFSSYADSQSLGDLDTVNPIGRERDQLAIAARDRLIDGINLYTGLDWDPNGRDTARGLKDYTVKVVSYPDDTVPEVNFKDFRHCVVITAPKDSTWGCGSLFLHINLTSDF